MTKSNIFKKIAAGVLSLTMLIGAVPAMAEESTDTEAVSAEVSLLKDHELELLMKLNIVTEAMSKLKPEEMSRGVFSEMLTAMLGVGGGDNAIEELYNLGIVSGYGNGKLKENQTITYYEAIKMVVCALGYANLAEANGGYPLGYVKVAYDCDLISGSVENTNLTYDQGMKLMLDAGNCNMATLSNDYYLSGIELGGDTMFYTYFDVMRVEGLISANGYTSLDGKGCLLGEVIIGGNVIETNDTNVSDYLGYYVEAYCYDDKVMDKVIVSAPLDKYNKELTILAGSYINVTGNLRKFNVKYEREDGKIDDIDVEDYYVIYNGKLYGGLTLDQLNASLADVTFIDNDKDNIYEIVKIDRYETYVVESVNPAKYELYAKYGKSLTLDPDEQDVFIFKSSGKPGEFKDIVSGAALSVLMSEDGNLVKAYILGEAVSGAIDGIAQANNHTVLTIGGEKYVVSYEYEQLVAKPPYSKVEPVMSAAVKAYLDLKGNIVEMETTSGVWLYGWVMKLKYDVAEEKITTISIFSQTNKRVDLTVGDRVTVDGISRKVTDLDDVGVISYSGETPKVVQQLVRYREQGGKLTQLDTWNVYNKDLEDEDALGATKDTDMCEANGNRASGTFNRNVGYFFAGKQDLDASIVKDVLVGASNDTITFVIPTDGSSDDEFYLSAQNGVGPYAHKSSYSVDAYNMDEAGIAKVLIKPAKDLRRSQPNDRRYQFLTDVSTVLNANGEPTTQVKAINLMTGAEYEKVATVTNTDAGYIPNEFFATKQYGDIFSARDVNIPEEGSVLYSVFSVLDPSKNYGYMSGNNYVSMVVYSGNRNAYNNNVYFSDYAEYFGKIEWASNTHARLEAEEDYTIGTNTGRETLMVSISGANIYLVDLAEETIEKIDSTRVASYIRDKIGEDCKTYVVTTSGKVDFMVIYTNLSARD